jgi:two-component system, NtrC family, sensor kinase
MRSARQSAVRLLQLIMIASIVFPVALLAFASWLSYDHEFSVADERIDRSLDILHEHTLKVFQTVERAIAETDEVMRGMSDDDIRRQQSVLHDRMKRIVDAMPQLRSIFLADRNGRLLVSTRFAATPDDADVSDRDFFRVHVVGYAGTYVSEVMATRLSDSRSYYFALSRRRPSADGSFTGVVVVALVPEYFEEFYAQLGRSSGSVYALVRADGKFLARYPQVRDRLRGLVPGSGLHTAMAQGWERTIYTIPQSQIDGAERRVGYRKLEGFPVYVVAGFDSSAIRAGWLSTMAGHLIFGLPATVLLLTIIGVALKRTRRLHDEAERRETAEIALRGAQRLEAIGKLTGGVAHDFNNLLMIVDGSAQRLRRDLTDEKHLRLIDMITNAATRGESLTRQLLTFSRRQMLDPAVIDLTQRIPELKEMLNRSLRGDITTQVAVPKEPCAVKVDPSELELALLNLAVNARDAMPNGGALSITVKPVVLRGQAVEDALKGEFVAIRVADTGSGIAPEILPHVFEPFFTTKDVGKGTGLGLSQVYGFARQSGGTATVTSSVGRGTVITLYLPRSRDLPAPALGQTEPDAAPKRTGTVLVVEDNAEVAEVASAYLQQLGYLVKQVADAHEALELLGNDRRIDVVFADILMPGGMTGLELGHAVRQLYPGLPVLLATGYSDSVGEALAQGFVVLEKPFDLAALDQGLRDARGRVPKSVQRAAG